MLSTSILLREIHKQVFQRPADWIDGDHLAPRKPYLLNRLALLQALLKEFSTIADFSEIVTENKPSSEGAA